MELDLGESGVGYSPGDLLAILPRQRPDAVAALLQRCNLDPQSLVQIERLSADGTRPESPMTTQVGTLLPECLCERCLAWVRRMQCAVAGTIEVDWAAQERSRGSPDNTKVNLHCRADMLIG